MSRGSLLPVGDAAAVLAGVPPAELAGESRAVRELWDTEVEASTGICLDLAQVRDQLARNRAALRRSARARGLELVPAGHPLLGAETAPPRGDGHYAWMSDAYAGALADQEVCGCHVHVGLGDREIGVAVLNHLAPWLPTLLALTANSPFRRGRNSGFHSWRMMVQTRLQASGIPPCFGSAAEYDADLARLRECGLLPPTTAACAWPACPTTCPPSRSASPTPPSRPTRRCSTPPWSAPSCAPRGGSWTPVGMPAVAVTPCWAMRCGRPPGTAVAPWSGTRASPRAMASRRYRHTADALAATADLDEVRTLLHALLTRGNGAMRQRLAAARHGVAGALDMLTRDAEDGPRHRPDRGHRSGGE